MGAHLITIERTDGAAPVAGWTVAYDGEVTVVADLEAAMCFAADLGAKAWTSDRNAVRIVLRRSGDETEVGSFDAHDGA